MDLDEFKKMVEAEEAEKQETKPEETEDVVSDENTDPGKQNDDSEGEKAKEKTEVEPWMKEEDAEGDQTSSTVPLGAHIKVKHKLKGRISEQDDEIAKLRAELEQERSKSVKTSFAHVNIPGKRPRPEDFDDVDKYDAAVIAYEDRLAEDRYSRIEAARMQQQAFEQTRRMLESGVDSHYERAAKLIESAGISPEVYKQTDESIRLAVEAIRPKQGDMVIDQMITLLGEGSEKVMYYLGKNKTALSEFKARLIEDPTGLKASIYLGEQKARLLTPQKRISTAPPPATEIDGGSTSGSGASAEMLRKYKAAMKSDDIQAQFNLRSEAKKKGIDISEW